jgi:GTPase SAR1 family protein
MREQYMRTGEGFVICYSVTDRRSFEEAVTYKRLVDRVRNHEDVPIVLVGNKCDLQLERKVCSVTMRQNVCFSDRLQNTTRVTQ